MRRSGEKEKKRKEEKKSTEEKEEKEKNIQFVHAKAFFTVKICYLFRTIRRDGGNWKADATFFSLSAADLISKWMGESEKMVLAVSPFQLLH